MAEKNRLHGVLIVFIILLGTVSVIQSSDWDFNTFLTNKYSLEDKDLDTPDFNSQLLQVFKDELQNLRKDLTASFVEEHSRRKRATENYEYEATLVKFQAGSQQKENSETSIETDDVAPTTVIFKDFMYIFQIDGIYRIDGLDRNNETYYENINSNGTDLHLHEEPISKVFVSSWGLTKDDRMIATIEKNNVLFILVENRKDGFSLLYTFSDATQNLVLRQRIRNHGSVTAAKFFVFYDQLFLIIANDNRVHSLTICPIFQWMGTYLDEIHTIQTRGASAVETFVIEGYQYIAISQALDAAGNSEIGTQVVRMNRRGELEKVQLLYSNSPVALHFTKIYHEHILIIAQKKEPAIVYFFGGYDFVYLQHLPTLKGESVSIVSVLAPDGETYIFASSGKQLDIFVRASNYSPLTSLMFSPYPNSTFTAPNSSTIIGLTAKPPKFSYGQPVPTEDLVVSITYSKDSKAVVDLRTLVFVKKPKVANSYKQPEDKLSKCLVKLKTSLDSSEPTLQQLLRSNATILRKQSNMVYGGVLNSQTLLTVDSQKSIVENLRIHPNVNPEEELSTPPSRLQAQLLADISDIQNTVNVKLQNVLIQDETNELTGKLNFVNGVHIKNLMASQTQLKLTQLNGVPWSQLRHNTLRNDDGPKQIVSGAWEVNKLKTKEVWTGPADSISGINLNDILLTESEVTQVVSSPLEFKKNVMFSHGIGIPPGEYINDILVSDIVNRTGGPFDVTGIKAARTVNLGIGTNVTLVNNMYLDKWYDSVLKTNEPDQEARGNYFFHNGFSAAHLKTKLVNNLDWDAFISQVLIDGSDQVIKGAHFDHLVVQDLEADIINAVNISDLLTTVSSQNVMTPIYLDKLIVHKNIENEWVNGIQLTQNVVLKDTPNVTISGPVEFHDLAVEKVELGERVLISNIDVPRMAQEGKTVVYRLHENASDSIVFIGKVYTMDADTPYVNEIPISDFNNNYWKIEGNNIISAPEIDFSKYNVEILESFSTKSLNQKPLDQYVTINGGPSTENIYAPINFTEEVVVQGHLVLAETTTLNNIDISEFSKKIVSVDHQTLVKGVKTFTQPIAAHKGIHVYSINNISINDQVVMLRNGKSVYDIPGKTTFSSPVQTNVTVVHGPIENGGLVNGHNIKRVNQTTVYLYEPAIINSNVEFLSPVTHVKDLYIHGYLNNNISMLTTMESLIPLNTGNLTQNLVTDLVIRDNLEFAAPVQIDLINGVSPNEYFSTLVSRSADEFIENKKIFVAQVMVDDSLNCEAGAINNIHLENLEKETLFKSKDQVVQGNVVFKQLQANNIYASNVCGIPVNEFVFIDDDAPSVISSPVTFVPEEGTTTPTVTVIEGHVELEKSFNGHDIRRVEHHMTNIIGEHKFNSVTCKGGLEWNESRNDSKQLSYLFNHAIKKNKEEQVVTGHVTFSSGFQANVLSSTPWLNNIDLKHIADDAVYDVTDIKNIEFTGKNVILGIVIGEHGSVEKLPSFYTVSVDGINLEELNQNVVRKNSTRVIKGTKTLNQHTFTESLFSQTINDCPIENSARIHGDQVINSLTLYSVNVTQNLNFHSLEGYDWTNFIHELVTFNSPQTVTGNITINGNLIVKDCRASRINSLNVSDLVLKNKDEVQYITGEKVMGGLTVDGEVQARAINNYDIDDMYSRMLHKNKTTTINQTVYYGGPVSIYNNIDVAHHVNDEHNLDHISHSFQAQLTDIVSKANRTEHVQAKVEKLLEILEKELTKSATWLDYFRFSANNNDNKLLSEHVGHKNRVEVTVFDNLYARLSFSNMVRVTSDQSGMPHNCLCNNVDFVELTPDHYKHMGRSTCKNIFELSSSNSEATFTVFSTYVSYNDTCQSATPGITDVIALPNGKLQIHQTPESSKDQKEPSAGDVVVSRVDTGYITDAKIFHFNGIDYIAIAQFYDHKKGAHKGQVSIYAVASDSSLILVQTIPTVGTIRLVVELINGVWIMGVANSNSNIPVPSNHQSENDEELPYETLSEIYFWSNNNQNNNHYYAQTSNSDPSASHGSFKLLRSVSTKNIVDLEMIRVFGEHRHTEIAFMAFLHSGNVIELYKFDWMAQNFYLDQTISFDDQFQLTALNSFSLGETAYLVVSSVPQGLIVYEYRCIEGFKKYLEVPLSEVQDITSFVINDQLLLPVASSYETFIAEAKIQGIYH